MTIVCIMSQWGHKLYLLNTIGEKPGQKFNDFVRYAISVGVSLVVVIFSMWYFGILLAQGAVLDKMSVTAALETSIPFITLMSQFSIDSGLEFTPESNALIFCF